MRRKQVSNLILGFFDGVHLAHKKIIQSALELGGETALVTFEKSPMEYFQDCPVQYLCTNQKKIKILKSLGVELVCMLDFKEIMNLSAQEYLSDILVKNFSPQNIVTGFNHKFGKNRQGDANFLLSESKKYNYNYIQIEPIELEDRLISSTSIRFLLLQGQIQEANALLGRVFSVSGKVVLGNRLGRTLGFPTANIEWPKGIIKLPYGVYSGEITLKGKMYRALINWGTRKSVSLANKPVLEAHILNFSEDIYGQEVEVLFKKKLREEIKFSSMDELKAQIQKDVNSI